MAKRLSNIEPVARNLCAADLRTAPNVEAWELPGLVDRYWEVVAAEIMAGLRDDRGTIVPHSVKAGIAAWGNWLNGWNEESCAGQHSNGTSTQRLVEP